MKAVSKYHQPSPTKHIEQYVHHLLFSSYRFRNEGQLKSSFFTSTYLMKLWEPGLMDIININMSVMELYSEIVEEASGNLSAHLTNSDAALQQ